MFNIIFFSLSLSLSPSTYPFICGNVILLNHCRQSSLMEYNVLDFLFPCTRYAFVCPTDRPNFGFSSPFCVFHTPIKNCVGIFKPKFPTKFYATSFPSLSLSTCMVQSFRFYMYVTNHHLTYTVNLIRVSKELQCIYALRKYIVKIILQRQHFHLAIFGKLL